MRFDEKYEPHESGCWLWTSPLMANGYAFIWSREARSNCLAHRVSYERFVGPIPEGLEIDHTCNVRHCVNPAHLAVETHAENRRLSRERKTSCNRGHAFDEKNTRWRNGNRYCRACCAATERERYRRFGRDRKKIPATP